ncbi:MAG: hypothetical protein JSS82_09260 [Bacteroidetes bacterium]|nr:hypothetical protein [Bacteroidota bacterium]
MASCDCNDYSLLTANTGIGTVSVANPGLDGSGTLVKILTAGSNGTIIKSIIIKSVAPTTQGMVRLFIRNAAHTKTTLIREVPIPMYPVMATTPTPAPTWPMIEIDLVDEITLQASDELVASTQNAQTFNIIAEGLNWAYPGTLPGTCCNFKQETAVTGQGFVSTANTNLNGTGSITPVFAAATGSASNGSLIESITITALQSTLANGMVRFFVSSDGGTTYTLMMEAVIPQSTQSAFEPSLKRVLPLNFNLAPDYLIGASTQLGEAFAISIEGTSWHYPI